MAANSSKDAEFARAFGGSFQRSMSCQVSINAKELLRGSPFSGRLARFAELPRISDTRDECQVRLYEEEWQA